MYVYMCIHICNRNWVDPKLVDTGQDADRSPGWTSDFSNVGPAARATAADSEPWLGQRHVMEMTGDVMENYNILYFRAWDGNLSGISWGCDGFDPYLVIFDP